MTSQSYFVPVCSACGSLDISGYADTVWDRDTHQWVVTEVDDEAWCKTCGDAQTWRLVEEHNLEVANDSAK